MNPNNTSKSTPVTSQAYSWLSYDTGHTPNCAAKSNTACLAYNYQLS